MARTAFHRPGALAALTAVILLAACTGEDPQAGTGPTRTPSTSTTTPASSPSPSSAPGPITLAFGGDVHFTTHLAGLLDDPADGLRPLRRYLAGADLAMVNLETAITTRGTPAPKQFHFRAPRSALRALESAGVDVVSLANNHAVDYGPVGLRDTLAAQRKSPIPMVGIGADADQAYAPAYLRVRDSTVAVLAGTQVSDWTLATWPAGADRAGVASAAPGSRLIRAVRAAARRADVVVVYLHWGTEYTTCPNARQRSTARALARAGADVVLGSHAHRVQGAGWLGRTYVGYGLGNFVWWRHAAEADATSGVLTLTVQPTSGQVTRAKWTPMLVTASGLPARQAGATGRRLLAAWNDARDCTGLAARPR